MITHLDSFKSDSTAQLSFRVLAKNPVFRQQTTGFFANALNDGNDGNESFSLKFNIKQSKESKTWKAHLKVKTV
jgi:hypothetical protein